MFQKAYYEKTEYSSIMKEYQESGGCMEIGLIQALDV